MTKKACLPTMLLALTLLAAACGGTSGLDSGASSGNDTSAARGGGLAPVNTVLALPLPPHDSLPATEENADEWTCGGDLLPSSGEGNVYRKAFDPIAQQYVCAVYQAYAPRDFDESSCREGWNAIPRDVVLENGRTATIVNYCRKKDPLGTSYPAQSVYWPGKVELRNHQTQISEREVTCREYSTTADISDFLNLNPGSDVSHKGKIVYGGANEFAVCPPPELLLGAAGYERPYWGYEQTIYDSHGWVLVSPRDCEIIPVEIIVDGRLTLSKLFQLEVACEAHGYCHDLVLARVSSISRGECDEWLILSMHAHCDHQEGRTDLFFEASRRELAKRCRAIVDFVSDSLESKTRESEPK